MTLLLVISTDYQKNTSYHPQLGIMPPSSRRLMEALIARGQTLGFNQELLSGAVFPVPSIPRNILVAKVNICCRKGQSGKFGTAFTTTIFKASEVHQQTKRESSRNRCTKRKLWAKNESHVKVRIGTRRMLKREGCHGKRRQESRRLPWREKDPITVGIMLES